MSTTTHVQPGQIGLTRSEAYPLLFVPGDRAEMLKQDLTLAGNQRRAAEQNLLNELAELPAWKGARRQSQRAYVLDAVADLRRCRTAYDAAWSRWYDARPASVRAAA